MVVRPQELRVLKGQVMGPGKNFQELIGVWAPFKVEL